MVSPECLNGIPRVPRGCIKGVSTASQGRLNVVPRVLLKMFPRLFLKMFQECFQGVPRFMRFSRIFHGDFQGVLRLLEGSF